MTNSKRSATKSGRGKPFEVRYWSETKADAEYAGVAKVSMSIIFDSVQLEAETVRRIACVCVDRAMQMFMDTVSRSKGTPTGRSRSRGSKS